jgi:outer membrane protein
VQAVGVTAGYLRQLTPRWGIYSYAKYDRLVGDAADSPIVRQFGSRDQFSGGLALTYTFGGGRD